MIQTPLRQTEIECRHKRQVGVVLPTSIVLLLAACNSAHAIGSRIPNQDASAIARGNAFVATADNPSAIYYNPAGISQLEGHNVQLGTLFYLNLYADYESPAGVQIDNEEEIIPVPNFHYVYSPQDSQWSFGIGFYAPFGLGMKWPADAPFRNSGIEAQILFLTVNPVVAWEPIEGLSLALGPTLNYSEARLRQGLEGPPFFLPYPFEFDFEGNDWSYGFNAGLLWQPHPKWSFGAKYFSASSMDYQGEGQIVPAGTTLDTTTHLEYPQMFTVGVSFRPTTNWNFEINLDYTDWDVVKTADINAGGVQTTVPFFWKSSWFYEFGLTRNLGKGYYISAGYFFSEASTPEAYYTPLVPDIDLHTGSLGFGFRGEHWSWAVAGQVIGGSYRDIDNQVVDPSVNGRWRLFTPTITASLGYRF